VNGTTTYSPPPPDLDAAWAEAEAALAEMPEQWRIYSVHRGIGQDRGPNWPETWSIVSHPSTDYRRVQSLHEYRGDLPAALRAFAAQVRAALSPATEEPR
jgi:hypothetical protein